MAKKRKPEPETIEVSPDEAIKLMTTRLKERLDLETLLAGCERDAQRCLKLNGPGSQYARNTIEFVAAARRYVAAGDVRQAAVWSLKAGATAERLRLETLFAQRWWKQRKVCDAWRLTRYKVSRDVAAGVLHTNGCQGQDCRIDPFSACRAYGFPWSDEDLDDEDLLARAKLAKMRDEDSND